MYEPVHTRYTPLRYAQWYIMNGANQKEAKTSQRGRKKDREKKE